MAYRAEIEIAVKGASQLSSFQGKLNSTALAVDQLNKFLKNFSDNAEGIPRSISNLNRQLGQAAESFNDVALGTKEARQTAVDYLTATRNLNAGLQERARLLVEVAENERKAKLASAGIRETTQYPGPIGPGAASAARLSSNLEQGRLSQRAKGLNQYQKPVFPQPDINREIARRSKLRSIARATAKIEQQRSKRLAGQNSLTSGLLRLNNAVLNAARSEAEARGESVAKQRELNRQLAKSQQYSRPIGPKPQRAAPTRRGTGIFGEGQAVLKLGGAYLALNKVVRQVGKSINTATQAASGEQRIKALSAGFDDYREVLAATERAQEKFNLGTIESQDAFAQLFGRLRPAGFALSEVETIFNGFNTAAALTGATARESAGALLQLTQALGAGFLSGQEFNSVAEQAPAVLQAIAKEVDRPIGQLKQLAKDGKLTSEVLLNALKRVETEGADRLAEALDTPAQKLKNLQNNVEDLNIELGKLVLPAVEEGLEGVSGAAEKAAEEVIKTQQAAKTLNEQMGKLDGFFKAIDANPVIKWLGDIGKAAANSALLLIPFANQIKTLVQLRDILAGQRPKFENDGFIGPQVPENLKSLKDRLGLDDPDDPTGKGPPRAPKLPTSKAFQLQQQISQELLKQFDIKTKYMQLNMSESEALDFQNTRLRERLQREESLLEFQRQQALATNKYDADAELLNELFNTRLVTLRGQTEAQIQQNLVSAKQLKIQKEITALKQAEETKGIERGLTRSIKDIERKIASPFGGDDAEQIDLLVEQQRRYKDITDQVKTSIAEQKKLELTDTSGAATNRREALEEQLSIYEKLLPQLNAVEQAELRRNQLMEKYGFIADEAATAMSSAVQSIITGTGSVQEAFSNMFANIGKAFIDMATQMIAKALIMKAIGILTSAFGSGGGGGGFNPNAPSITGNSLGDFGGGSFGGFMADGGPVSANQPYVVGERGPELFIPGASGSISNNDQFEAARKAMGGSNK